MDAGRNDELAAENAELRRMADIHESMLDATEDGFVVTDEDGVVIACSDSAEAIYGYSAADMIGRVFAEVVLAPEARESHHARRRELLDSGIKSEPYRIWVTHKDGHDVLIGGTTIAAPGGDRTVVYVVQDATDLALREQERHAGESVNQAVLNAAAQDDLLPLIVAALGESLECLQAGFWEYDERLRSIHCTEFWTSPRPDVPTAAPLVADARFPLDAPQDEASPVPLAWETGTAQWSPFAGSAAEMTAPDGAAMLGSVFVIPVVFGGAVLGALALSTQDTQPPGPLRHAALQAIANLAGQVLGRRRAEEAADRRAGELLAVVSHELRTPLTSAIGFLELVIDEESGELTTEQKQFLDIVDRSTSRLLRLVGDLLFVAQIDTGRIALDLRPADLREIVRHAIEAAAPAAEAGGITLSEDAPAAAPIPAGDVDRLGQLVDNLISNAIKFTPRGGSVFVRAFVDGDAGLIEVQDTGPGLSVSDQAHIFERFFRTEQTHRDAVEGLGLGLSICRAIVDAHGGMLTVHGAPGRGTTLRAAVPAG
jgi:PAS domain S-box-containing protein